MSSTKQQKQENINEVWSQVWTRAGDDPDIKKLFGQRLFFEGYPVFKKYIPEGTESILDVGAGSGRYGLMLARDFPHAHVTLTDIVDESLELMSCLTERLSISNVTIQKEDACNFSFPDETFDVVYCGAAIMHMPQYQNAVKEMTRILKPHGTLILSSVNLLNPYMFGKKYLDLIDRGTYGYEKEFSNRQLVKLVQSYHMRVVATDGFYFAYCLYRLKVHHDVFRLVSSVVNRTTKFLDKITGRMFSRYFGFEIFCVAQKR